MIEENGASAPNPAWPVPPGGRDLSWREEMEPYRRSNNAESEAGETGHKGRSKCAGRE